MSVLEKLTEGIVNRDLQKEGAALLAKWENTGLLEGLGNERSKDTMARLLENQAKELLREAASTMAGGDVEGFASVAFPIVRRVFGSLIANDLVSVQPMSLPSGLIFFLDFTYGESKAAAGAVSGESIYGGDKVGQQITGGVDLGMTLDSDDSSPEKSFYGLNNGYSSPTGSVTTANGTALTLLESTNNYPQSHDKNVERLAGFDPDIPSGSAVCIAQITRDKLVDSNGSRMNFDNLVGLDITLASSGNAQPARLVRRLTSFASGTNQQTLNLVFIATSSAGTATKINHAITGSQSIVKSFAIEDNFNGTAAAPAADALGVIAGADTWGLENTENIPELNIKVDSVSVTAVTKKLKAKWTPELGQDLNAYHNLDAEVELTSILSEQIALEIDREILKDLIAGATAGTLYWSRRPGRFLTRDSGEQVGKEGSTTYANESLFGADFTGTVSEWYETLVETINDVSAQIHRKTLRGGANFVVVSPEVANILEFTAGFRASVTADADRGTVGAVNVGSLSKKWDVYVDPYFPRNVVLVGRKGGSFLESGYVYAPYVPLQVTPTIFGVEDFVPRKGVMTRYAKKMVRPDMYGLVVVRDLNG
tara:strand:- start:2095 stop:3882 length:1788 start_codon:yes stop_codon:yes gene_type:complete